MSERPQRERRQVKRPGDDAPEATQKHKKKKAQVTAQTDPAEEANSAEAESKELEGNKEKDDESEEATDRASEQEPEESGEVSASEVSESEPKTKKQKKRGSEDSDKQKGKKKPRAKRLPTSDTESPTPKKRRTRSIVRHEGLPKLTSTNYGSWYEEVEDYLLTARAQEVLDKAQLRNGQEQDERADISDEQRIEIWYALRRSLTSEQKQTFQVTTGEVEELLRKVRQSNYKADTSTIALLMSDVADLQLAQFKNVQEFLNSSRAIFAKLDDIGHHLTDGLRIFFLRKALPASDYKTFLTVHADKITVSSFANALIAFATENGDVMGTLNVRKLRESTSTVKDTSLWTKGKGKGKGFNKGRGGKGLAPVARKEPCRYFTQAGYCRFGDRCVYDHVVAPTKKTEKGTRSGKEKGGKGSGKCWICGKIDHRAWDCSQALRNKVKTEKANVSIQVVNPEIYEEEYECTFSTKDALAAEYVHTTRGSCTVSCLAGQGPESGRTITVDLSRNVFATQYPTQENKDSTEIEKVFANLEGVQAVNNTKEADDSITVLLDGGSTCTILNSARGCKNIRGCNVTITTGSGALKCTQTGDFEGATEVDGVRVPIVIKNVRIAPEFGQPSVGST